MQAKTYKSMCQVSFVNGCTLISDVDMLDLRSTAVTEAKKWFEEQKLGSNSKLELEYGNSTLNTAMLPHVSNSFML